MLRHVPRDEPGIGVITAPGRRSDDNRDLLALVERRWPLGHRRAQGERRRESERCDEPVDGPFGKHNPSLTTIRARRRLLTIRFGWKNPRSCSAGGAFFRGCSHLLIFSLQASCRTERCRMAQATAPILDSTMAEHS